VRHVRWIVALVAIVIAPIGIAVALWVYVLGLGFAAEARPNQFMPIVLGMTAALDEHHGWARTLETGCSGPLTRFGSQKEWYMQDVPDDYRATYLDCVHPVMYGGCYPFIPSNCLRIAVHRFVLSQPDIWNEVVAAAIDPCRYEGKGDQYVSYFLHADRRHLAPDDAATTAKMNEKSCNRGGAKDYVIYVLNDDRTVFLKLSVSRS
jgi:hypothetical protein